MSRASGNSLSERKGRGSGWLRFLRLDQLRRLAKLLRAVRVDPAVQWSRVRAIERDVVLPVKAVYIAVLVYYLFFSAWFGETELPRQIAQATVVHFFVIYAILNVAMAILLWSPRRLSPHRGRWVVFGMSVVDAFFLAALAMVTGGFDSILYWLFLGLIVRNAISHPLARPQIVLNLFVTFCYVLAGSLDLVVAHLDLAMLRDQLPDTGMSMPETPAEPVVLRVIVLLLLTACCYGVQVLFENERQAIEEAREFSARQAQLHAAGRLAAQIAHKLKNPLGIINNAAFSIQRCLQESKTPNLQQATIIREEIDRADRIITELMGYAQLAEGHVERLNVVEELNRALLAVFPPGARYALRIQTDFGTDLPPLLMQKQHLSEILQNILQNAREAVADAGEIHVQARRLPGEIVEIRIKDNGPGIPPEKVEKIFEPYVTTKTKGTGLGLAIVRHNAEMYGAKVWVESELGHGSEFILQFPTRTFMKRKT